MTAQSMERPVTSSHSPDAFQAAHDRLTELRAILGIDEPAPVAAVASSAPAFEDGSLMTERTTTRAPRGRSVDFRNPADVLLIALWTATIGLLTAAFLATS